MDKCNKCEKGYKTIIDGDSLKCECESKAMLDNILESNKFFNDFIDDLVNKKGK